MDIKQTEVEKYGSSYSEDGLWGKISGNMYRKKRNPQLPNNEFKLSQFHFVESFSLLFIKIFIPINGKPPGNPNSSKKCKNNMASEPHKNLVVISSTKKIAINALTTANPTDILYQLFINFFMFIAILLLNFNFGKVISNHQIVIGGMCKSFRRKF